MSYRVAPGQIRGALSSIFFNPGAVVAARTMIVRAATRKTPWRRSATGYMARGLTVSCLAMFGAATLLTMVNSNGYSVPLRH